MSAPTNSKSASPRTTSAAGAGGFCLSLRTRVWTLAICMAAMVGGSVYAVVQRLNPNPSDSSFSARLWYPRETNPYARLQAVHCAKDKFADYACRLNAVAVVGAAELPEVWAVGNVGLVHRPAGQMKWEQLTITASEETTPVVAVAPAPTPVPTPAPTATPRPQTEEAQEHSVVPSYKPSPAPSRATPETSPVANLAPQRSVVVPYLIGMRLEEARKVAEGSGFQLDIEYQDGGAPKPSVQQGPPPDLVVIKQSPEGKTLAAPKSTITVILGRPRSAAGLFDKLIPTVYASERAPQQRVPLPADHQRSTSAAARQLPGSEAASPATHSFTLDDDLISVACSDKPGCWALGRSGRVYRFNSRNRWSYRQALFSPRIEPFSLAYANRDLVVAKVGNSFSPCKLSDFYTASYTCSSAVAGTDQVLVTTVTNSFLEPIASKHGDGITITANDDYSGFLTYTVRAGNTGAPLRALASGEGKNAFVVGDQGVILGTTDGGRTWRHETQGPEGARANYRLPAPWYWALAFLLIVICSAVVAAPSPPPPTEFSVADWTITDAPLKPGDVDSLGFTPMALGLSRFIRNPKTQPPVTIAIEGEWGEGKSSVMALLRGDLEKSRYRPVWFNAWHHQSEEQLLASLLEHIKEQAVPPWWHIDNWIFRARLVHFRLRGKWPLMVLLTVAFCGGVAFELSRHGLRMDDFVKFGTDIIRLIKYLLPWSKEKDLPDDLGHFGLLATVIAIFTTILKKARAFGLDPSKLTDNLRDAATIRDVKPDPGVRPRFAREFGDLCEAWSWGGRRVIIFIDDLDRCRPESVVTVLESINFLTTAGDCMMVLGMAEKQVTLCVGLGFSDIAEVEAAYEGAGGTEQAKAIARYKYGAFYIKKLVNIVVPLPKTTPEQRRRVLEARAAEVRIKEQQQNASGRAAWRSSLWDWMSQAGRMTFKVAPVFALAAAVVVSVLMGYKEGALQQSSPDQPPTVATGAAAQPSQPNDKGIVPRMAKPIDYSRPSSPPAVLADADKSAGGVWWSYAVNVLFLFILFAILAYQLSARTNQDAQNSPEFEESLQLWGEYILNVCDTPREIKRALNGLRYQAMIRRTNGPSITRGERLARAMRRFVTGNAEDPPVADRVDEAALPPLKAAELAGLSGDELKTFLDPDQLERRGSENLQRLIELKREHMRRFHRWIGEVTVATPSPAVEAENPPQARAAYPS